MTGEAWRAFAVWLQGHPANAAWPTPWHIFGDPTRDSPARDRVASTNPALLPLLSEHGSWAGALVELVQTGATADSIEAGDWIPLLPDFELQRWIRDALGWLRGEPTARRSRSKPIATPAQAREALTLLGSERPAAAHIRVSRTQLRRLLGKDQPTDY